jgi:hypothetical protein
MATTHGGHGRRYRCDAADRSGVGDGEPYGADVSES